MTMKTIYFAGGCFWGVEKYFSLAKGVEGTKVGYAKMMWCGDEACENKIKELTTATARCIPFTQIPFMDTCPVCGKKAVKVVLFAKAY